MRRFELQDGDSNKFWEVSVEGASLTVRFGRIGTQGQTQTKPFDTEAKATAEHDKLVREKTKKGYVEKGAPVPTSDEKQDEGGSAEPAVVAAVAPPATPKKAAPPKPEATLEPGWVDAGKGYTLALRDGKLVCRNARGQILASVPKDVKEGDVGEQLLTLREWLAAHDRECLAQVEGWMLRSLPTPRSVLESVWPDTAWRRAIENVVIVPVRRDGRVDEAAMGFFRGVDPVRGLGIVTLDGETVWVDAVSVTIPHPILLPELDELRGLATELSMTQGIVQLFREVFVKPVDLAPNTRAIDQFRGGNFAQLNHALGQCRKLGYRVTGGSSITRVWEEGRVYEARFWIGSDDPMMPGWTEDLTWVDERERPVPVNDVPRVAFSEGMRMASAIYAARVIEKETSDA